MSATPQMAQSISVSDNSTFLRSTLAQTRVELLMTLRRGESVLITVIVPVVLLVFFASLNIVPAGTKPVDFLLPGILALAVMATGMVSLGIATAYERYYGVLKRLGGSPLPRSGLVTAKILSVLALEALQIVLLVGIAALAYGWRPAGDWLITLLTLILGTAAFAGLGLAMAGALRAEATLAGANGLYLVFLLLGGGILPLSHLPGPLAGLAQFLPAAALTDALRASMTNGAAFPTSDLILLAIWAAGILLFTIRSFKWE
ncbi:MAG TPA: ABC transporter permease [Ktedonobacterales bacterium]|jgi:ABC-2 type transport system permease protein